MTAKRYFGTDGIRGRVGEELINPEFVLKLGWAIGRVLVNGERKKVLIGKDTRISGYLLESALEAGLSAAGVDIHLLGPMPTPAISYLTRTLRAQAGIVISASHNLYHDNGIKFFSSEGRKLPDELEFAIEAQLDQPMTMVDSAKLGKAVRVNDAPGRYIEFCKSTVPTRARLSGMKIVVDCANGATYHIAPSVFRELGAEVIEMANEPNGLNINLECGSTKPELLCQRVIAESADCGIALDGDGDRLVLVDEKGQVVDGDEVLYIIAKERHEHGYLHGGVIGTVMSNIGLEKSLGELKIPFARAQVGDRYVLEQLEKADWNLGGEPSGHIICLDKTTTGDGIVAALQVLYVMNYSEKPLSQLAKGMQKFPQIMVNIPSEQAKAVLDRADVQAAVAASEQRLNGNGRVLLRPSGTEPLVRVMVEGDNPELLQQIANDLSEVVARQ